MTLILGIQRYPLGQLGLDAQRRIHAVVALLGVPARRLTAVLVLAMRQAELAVHGRPLAGRKLVLGRPVETRTLDVRGGVIGRSGHLEAGLAQAAVAQLDTPVLIELITAEEFGGALVVARH